MLQTDILHNYITACEKAEKWYINKAGLIWVICILNHSEILKDEKI